MRTFLVSWLRSRPQSKRQLWLENEKLKDENEFWRAYAMVIQDVFPSLPKPEGIVVYR